MSEAWSKTKEIVRFANPLVGLVLDVAEKAATSMSNASSGPIQELEIEAAKQQIQLKFAQQQARIAQELAIARRIENANEVEIEEYYDTSGKGHVGATVDTNSQAASLGAGGSGRQVTKRIYHFKGGRSNEEETIVQNPEQ